MSGQRWRRLCGGQYELRSAEGILIAVVERSSMRPWSWWWEVFTDKVCGAGNSSGMARAKSDVMTALATPNGANQ